jgi:hypothetical protein
MSEKKNEVALPAEPRALRESFAECEALSFTEDRGITVSEAESITLVLHELGRLQAMTRTADHFDFIGHLARQREWSERTFGPGARSKGVVDNIRKELREIESDPTDIKEWIDVVILSLDGAWRAGATPQQIIDTIVAKQTKNESRVWPDWRTMSPDQAIEHDRSHDAQA